MAIGNEGNTNAAAINNALGALAVRWHELADDTLTFFASISEMGISGIEAATGMAAQDATDTFNCASYMQTVAQIWYGTATQASDFDFDTQALIVRARGLLG